MTLYVWAQATHLDTHLGTRARAPESGRHSCHNQFRENNEPQSTGGPKHFSFAKRWLVTQHFRYRSSNLWCNRLGNDICRMPHQMIKRNAKLNDEMSSLGQVQINSSRLLVRLSPNPTSHYAISTIHNHNNRPRVGPFQFDPSAEKLQYLTPRLNSLPSAAPPPRLPPIPILSLSPCLRKERYIC